MKKAEEKEGLGELDLAVDAIASAGVCALFFGFHGGGLVMGMPLME